MIQREREKEREREKDWEREKEREKEREYIIQRSLFLGCLVQKYQISLPSIGQREIDTAYKRIILLSLIL
jgi:hypothetical protein